MLKHSRASVICRATHANAAAQATKAMKETVHKTQTHEHKHKHTNTQISTQSETPVVPVAFEANNSNHADTPALHPATQSQTWLEVECGRNKCCGCCFGFWPFAMTQTNFRLSHSQKGKRRETVWSSSWERVVGCCCGAVGCLPRQLLPVFCCCLLD